MAQSVPAVLVLTGQPDALTEPVDMLGSNSVWELLEQNARDESAGEHRGILRPRGHECAAFPALGLLSFVGMRGLLLNIEGVAFGLQILGLHPEPNMEDQRAVFGGIGASWALLEVEVSVNSMFIPGFGIAAAAAAAV